MQWVAVPLTVFGFCYFVVGPVISAAPSNLRTPSANWTDTAPIAEPEPIEQGKREWIPVMPPQVNVTVTPLEEEEPPEEEQFDDASPPPVDAPPDSGGGDEAGIGGIAKPPPTGGDDGSLGRGVIGGNGGF
jgi:hypothetical protein